MRDICKDLKGLDLQFSVINDQENHPNRSSYSGQLLGSFMHEFLLMFNVKLYSILIL